MKVDEDDEVALEVISLVGVIVSVVCLVLTIITLLAFKYVQLLTQDGKYS